MSTFRLLVITDVHYVSDAAPTADAPGAMHFALGRELLRRAIEDADRRGGFDAIALLGDLINDSGNLGATADLRRLRREVEAAAPGVPLLLVGGNHDSENGGVPAAFEFRPGLVELGGYRFLAFSDAYENHRLGRRRESDRRLLREVAARPGGPIVALQHNPMNPQIEDEYPYILTDREGVMADYARAGVLLSVSGHYHAGQPLNVADGVRYYTVGALTERPFRYAVIELRGRDVEVCERQLSLEDLGGLVDGHVHTEFAYCGKDITAGGGIERARTFGLAGVCLVEHAPQLYCRPEDFWRARHVHEPGLWRRPERSRMAPFRRAMDELRGDFVRVGLEVELDAAGDLTLTDEDRDWADRILGAVHWLPDDAASMNEERLLAAFLRTNEAILARGVDVLAHPCRFLHARNIAVPTAVHARLAEMLAATGTAAEINLHNERTEAAFVAECIRRGVKIALGSDAHELWEAALLTPHIELLRQAAGAGDVADLLLG